jgi:hypothetical protein
MTARGVDLEIIEKPYSGDSPNDHNLTVPTCVFINGQEVLVPTGSKIVISEISDRDLVTVTLTMFVGSLSLRSEGRNVGPCNESA